MVKIFTLLAILTLSTLFIHVPHRGSIGFPMHPTMENPCTGETVEIKLSYTQYVWMAAEHLIMIALAWIILDESKDHKFPLKVFLLLQVGSLVGFVIAYSDPLKKYVITYNILKIAIFLSAIVIDKWKPLKRELRGLRL